MKKILNIFLILAMVFAASSCYDDALVRQEVDAIEKELLEKENAVADMESQMNNLNTLLKSQFVSYINVDDKGKCIISYKTGEGETQTIELALAKDINKFPFVNARKDTDNKLYWAQTADNGKTFEWILDEAGKKMPVGGVMPEIAIDAEGYWTVNGQRALNKDGQPILANDISNLLFKSVTLDGKGSVHFELTSGSSFDLPYYEALGITFDKAAMIAVPDRTQNITVAYTLTGSQAEKAVVDYFTAYNVDVKVDGISKNIVLKLHDGAEEGNVVIMATAGDVTVLKPIFLTFGSAEIQDPTWKPEYGTSNFVALPGELTEFGISVSANIDYDITLDPAATWLKKAPGTKAEMTVLEHKFIADYYENESGADREASILFCNKAYGVNVTVKVKQSPVPPAIPTDPGISKGADLVAFAKAVSAGADLKRWQNEAGEVVLLEDIDLTEVKDWTPMGAGKCTGNPAFAELVNPFTGVFNGQGHTIKGINWTFEMKNAGTTDLFGFFGAIKDATIKDLILGADGDQIVINGSTTDIVAVGALAGYAEGSTIVNVRNNVSVLLKGDNPAGTLMMLGGVTGCAKATVFGGEKKDMGVINAGNVKTGAITNPENGGKGMNVGGFSAFTLGEGVKLGYCVNYGEISAPTGRGGGFVGTLGGSKKDELANTISNCTNYGLIQDDAVGMYNGETGHHGLKRMGGFVGGTSDNPDNLIEYCTNEGNVFSQLGCRCGGFVGHNKAKVTGCVNKGIILANITYNGDAPEHGPGWACGYGGKGTVTKCVVGGKVGEWTAHKDNPSGAPDATEDNAFCYKNADYYLPFK